MNTRGNTRNQRHDLERSLRAQHDKLSALEKNLFLAGFGSESADVQWACIMVWNAIISIEKTASPRSSRIV